jgi:hypothetical protein
MDGGASSISSASTAASAPMPTWVKIAIDAWTMAAGIADGHVFRPVNRAGVVTGEHLGEKVVWLMLRGYAAESAFLA